MGNTCSSQKKFRFKNFVLAVYPEDPHAGPVKDAMGKLESYVASNPERIPRVCRKISKLLAIHLKHHKVQRVMVGVQMLRHLIAQSAEVSGFVPHSIEICATLLAEETVEYNIGAADILAILCYKLADRADGEQSRRLIADSKKRLLPLLEIMCAAGHTGSKEAARSHFAALIALGNVTHCLHGALADLADRLLAPLLHSLYASLHQWQRPVAEWRAALRQGPFDSVVLLADGNFMSAAAFGVAAAAGCVSAAGAQRFLSRVEEFVTSRSAWSPPLLPCAAFWSVVRGMEGRPQQLGFVACEFLCRLAQRTRDAAILTGAVCALTECIAVVRMTGGRPRVIFEAVRHAMGVASRDKLDVSVLRLTSSLLRATHAQHNAPQLHSIVVGLLSQLRDGRGALPGELLALRALAVAAPYVRTVPLTQREDIDIAAVVAPFLQRPVEQTTLAARCLVGLLTGVPDLKPNPAEVNGEDEEVELETERTDVAAAQQWAFATVSDSTGVTPSMVIEIGRVATAVMQSEGSRAFPFAIALAAKLQEAMHRRARKGDDEEENDEDEEEEEEAERGSEDGERRTQRKKKGNTRSHKSHHGGRCSELHVALAQLATVVIANAGVVYTLPRVTAYAMDVLQNRLHKKPSELAPQFASRLVAEASGTWVFQLAPNIDVRQPLQTEASTGVPITALMDFMKVADELAAGSATSTAVTEAFGTTNPKALRHAVAALCHGDETATIAIPTPPLAPRAQRHQERPFAIEMDKQSALRANARRSSGAAPIVVTIVDHAQLAPPRQRSESAGALKSVIGEILARCRVNPAMEMLRSSEQLVKLPLEQTKSSTSMFEKQQKKQVSSFSDSNSPVSPTNRQLTLYQSFRTDDDGFYADGPMRLGTSDAIKARLNAGSNISQEMDYNEQLAVQKTSDQLWGNALPASKYMDIM